MSNRKFTATAPYEILVAPPPGSTRRKFTQQVITDDQGRATLGLLTGSPEASTSTLTVSDASFDLTDIQATGLLTILTAPLTTGDTITIGGTTLTGTAGVRTPGSDDFDVTLTTPEALASEITAAINDGSNSFTTIVTAAAMGDMVILTAVATGSAGNVSLATSTDDIAISGDTLIGGASVGTATVNLGEFTLVVGVNWEPTVGDTAASATSLAAAIDNLPGFSASAVGSDITITGPTGPDQICFLGDAAHFTLTPDSGFLAVGGPSIGPPLIS